MIKYVGRQHFDRSGIAGVHVVRSKVEDITRHLIIGNKILALRT